MRIAFDLDGVLADLHKIFADSALRLFPELDAALVASPGAGSSPPVGDGADESEPEIAEPRTRPLGRDQSAAVWRELCSVDNFWESLAEIEAGAIKRLATVANEHRWEIIFLTSRPHAPGRTVQRQSQLWLERHGFPLPSVYVVQGSRGRIAAALDLDVVVDDRPDNCLDVALESKARAILVWRDPMTGIPPSAKRLGIGAVASVGACLDLLVEADRDKGAPGDLIQRLRRLLGLAPRPAAPKRGDVP
jgi:hypothetical protein